MNIVFVTDNNVVDQLEITIDSIYANRGETDEFHFYYIAYGLSDTNRELVEKKITDLGGAIDIIAPKEKYLDVVENARIKVVYSYCFLHEMLPENVDKALMLETDMIVNGSLGDLYDTNIDDYYIAATDDMQSRWYKKKLGMSEKSVYFNSGVMLLNLKKIREQRMTDKICRIISSGKFLCAFDVQDELNAIFEGKIKVIPPKYNFTSSFVPYNYENYLRYRLPSTCCTKNEFDEAREHPVIIHFTRSQLIQPKPWLNPCDHPYRDKYLDYFTNSNHEKRIDNAKFTVKRKFVKLLYSSLPAWLSASLLGIVRAYFFPKYLYKYLKHN